ncbi:DASH family cryptochrome [Winogradskyella maritima]|uniref:Cryptochrome DASH n=1 Tax=Winogradskyella maritima TaxID=1517766 RepID=A0ABV8AGA2_9FLAO|nr:DASH family cryptochrome [Winogradskyella maritima]
MQKTTKNNGLVWFRNDLRTLDNTSLHKACAHNGRVIGVYCLDPFYFEESPFGFQKTGKFRAKFLLESLSDLKSELEALNIPLFVLHEASEKAIQRLVEKFDINTIYFQNEWTSEEKSIETKVRMAVDDDVKFESFYDQFLFHPDDAVSEDFSNIPKVFTNFRKSVEKKVKVRPTLPKPSKQKTLKPHETPAIPTLEDLGFEDFQTHPSSAFPFQGGNTSANARLDNYFFKTKKLGVYKKTRNGLVGTNYSSKFSPWLANGGISARTIFENVKAFEQEHFKNQSTYWLIFELIWRDFFKYISLKHGNSIFQLSGILDKDYHWETDERLIQQWIDGETNSDFVNANMLEIKHTGWMSNRGRQNVASYFAKTLNLDWRIGASYFESLLLDYDVHSNYGNWLYVAGVGNDPRDRVFNVDLQAERYDGQGKFRNLWLQPKLF